MVEARVVSKRANGNSCEVRFPYSQQASWLLGAGSLLRARTRRLPVCMCTQTEKRIYAVKRLAVSTGQLRRLPALHTRPIDLVVFQEPTPIKGRRPNLEGSFTLICLQRLSLPYIATQRCPERNNWHTRGTSLPILSY
jgi:hypothetical protein